MRKRPDGFDGGWRDPWPQKFEDITYKEIKMPNVSDLSDYITPDVDVKDGDIVTIQDPGEIFTFEDGNKRLQLKLKLANGQVKKMTMNLTSQKNLADAYGNATEAWAGKAALVAVTSQNVRGNLKRVCYLMGMKG